MARKKWAPRTDITPGVISFRERKKWQISFRRYVLDKTPCPQYAPYFGLDIENMRSWIEMQFEAGIGWEDFALHWQFEHIVPVACFDFARTEDLQLCWNFTNIKVSPADKAKSTRFSLQSARLYFEDLYNETGYTLCLSMLHKIEQLAITEPLQTASQKAFLLDKKKYLEQLSHYSAFEFELLNTGRSLEQIMQEANFLKKF